MDWTVVLLAALQVLIGLGLYLLWLWLKALLASLHARQELVLAQHLSKELELFRISQSEINVRKVERFVDFAKLQADMLANEEFRVAITASEPAAVERLRSMMIELGAGLFFFASDEAVARFVRWKRESATPDANPLDVLAGLGDVMLALRKDVGYAETRLSGDHYLQMFVTDWVPRKDASEA